jgi:hypothetical protein
MTDFVSCSQAGQDQFVYDTLVKPAQLFNGTFLDIGCGHPVEFNNTYALEQLGWMGLLVDNDEYCCSLSKARKSPYVQADSTSADWAALIRHHFADRRVIDYLSLDVNGATLKTLEHLPLHAVRFRIITIEHDKYRFGPEPQRKMQAILLGAGYTLLREDVADKGFPFEDWYCKS